MLRKPKVSNARERLLSDEEEMYLLAALDNPEDIIGNRNVYMSALVRVAIESAMRQGELLGLEWENVRFTGSKGLALLPDTKNGTARDVPLSTKAATALKALPGKRSGRVFVTTASAVKQSWVRAVKRAKRNYAKDCVSSGVTPKPNFLENLTFHDLRHLATTRLAAKCRSEDLAKITGHKDNRMLMRYYHPRVEDLAELLD
jgi:integrase